jgi:hypothetical protein
MFQEPTDEELSKRLTWNVMNSRIRFLLVIKSSMTTKADSNSTTYDMAVAMKVCAAWKGTLI